MLTLLVVLAARAVILLAVVGLVVAVAVLLRRRLRRTGKWGQVQHAVRTTVLAPAGRTARGGGVRTVAVRALQHWVDGGTKR